MTHTSLSAPETAIVDVDPRRWKALSVIALVQFMLVLDITVVNVALSHIQSDLGFSRAGLAWVVDGYTLTAGGLLLLGRRLADLLGRKRMFLIGVAVFALASALSGAAADPGMLVAARFAQGTGEAIASPAAFGLIALLFTQPKERAQAIGIFGGMAGLGGTLGPIISGLLIAVVSWRWIFFVNVPIAILALFAVSRLVSESRASRAPSVQGARAARPDIAGAVLGTAGLVGVVYGLLQAASHPWNSFEVMFSLAAGGLLLVTFVFRERTTADPLVPGNFLHNRTRVTTNVASLFFSCAFFTMFFLLTLYFEQVRDYSALRTGLAYLPVGLVIGLGIGVSSALIPRLGAKPLLCVGSGLFTVGLFLLARISVHGSYVSHVLPGLVVCALGAGLSFSAFGNGSMEGVTDEDASLASGIQSTTQQVGGSVGLAVLATLATRNANHAVAHGVSSGLAFTDGTSDAFHIGAFVVLAGGLVVLASTLIRSRPRPAIVLVSV